MLKVTKTDTNRLDIELDGVLDADAMREGLDALIAGSEGITGGVMMYNIDEIALPTLEAIGVELRRLPQLFAMIGKFRKCAVVTDTSWVRTAAEIEGKLIPGLVIKSYTRAERDEAEDWLKEGGAYA